MVRKIAFGTILAMLLITVLTSAFNIRQVKASGTIYIQADGSVDPPTAPIERDGDLYTFTDNIYDSIVVERNNIIIDGNDYTLEGTGAWPSRGIDLSGRVNVTVRNTQIKNFYYGIRLYFYSYYNSISGNNITNNGAGIDIGYSSSNSISGNNITNNGAGIDIGYSSSNSISGNTFFNDGLYVGDSYVWGSYGNVVVDNFVNGRPLVYLDGVSDYAVDDAGQVILVNCNRIRVENLDLSHATIGVQLGGTNNTKISGNNITANNVFGIGLCHFSNYNGISGNNITNNGAGIGLGYFSNYNGISGNNITNNGAGIGLYNSSNYNGISANNIANNEAGIWLDSSSSNSIYHNNFIDNARQVDTSGSVNVWDDGYPSGGNYWSDYKGRDSDGDGIGDAPYIINADNVDNYPLMNRYIAGDVNYDGIVNSTDLSAFATGYGTMPDSPNWNVRADLNDDLIICVVDLFILGKNFGNTGA